MLHHTEQCQFRETKWMAAVKHLWVYKALCREESYGGASCAGFLHFHPNQTDRFETEESMILREVDRSPLASGNVAQVNLRTTDICLQGSLHQM